VDNPGINHCEVDHRDPSTLCALFCNNEDIDMFDIPSPFPVKDKQMVQLYFDGHSGGIWNINDCNYAFAMHVGSVCHAHGTVR
jgi:hypothetical protein